MKNTELNDDFNEFERQLIEECRQDGMSDEEIFQWLQEI